MIADAGFHWVRMDFKWDATERARGQYDFSAYDRLLKSLDEFGLRPVLILDYGNPLYGGTPPSTDAARQAFSNWALAAIQHFARRGVIWEIYNEPNLKMFWPTGPKADEYVALALAVSRGLPATLQSERLIAPAASTIDFAFLESCFKQDLLNGALRISVHPYRQAYPESVALDYSRLRQLISRFSDHPRDIISSEWGYSTAWRGVGEDEQAALMVRMFLTNAANGIPLSIWYDWRDDGDDADEPEHHFGLVRSRYRSNQAMVYEPKPAYLAMRTLSAHLNGYRFSERLMVGSDDDYVLVFGKESERRMVAWTTGAPHEIKIPNLTGTFLATPTTGPAVAQLRAEGGRLAVNVSPQPLYLRAVH